MSKKITLKDVARHAGVAPSTVSFVINGNPRVSDETRELILKAISDLNYTPNSLAQGVGSRGRTSSLIGLAIGLNLEQQTVAAHILAGLQAAAANSRFHLMLIPPSSETKGLDEIFSYNPVGIICSAVHPESIRDLLMRQPRMVIIDHPKNHPGVDFVGLDNIEGGRIATDHLIQLGHTRLACITGPYLAPFESNRVDGFRLSLINAGLPVRAEWIIQTEYTVEHGYRATRRLLEGAEPPTAIIAGSDTVACGIAQACADLGRAIPGDLSVIGFDDTTAALAVPPLTTIAQPFKEYGAAALRLLSQKLSADAAFTEQKVLLKPVLVERHSTGPAKRP